MDRRKFGVSRALLPPSEQARLEAYRLRDSGLGTDDLGTDPSMVARFYAFTYWLHEVYFRVRSSGVHHLPSQGAAVLVGNHGGVLPYDALMLVTDVFRRTDPPRLVHYMVDHFVYRLPFLGVLFRQLGQIPGSRRNFDGLVEDGHLVGVFPEGAQALNKPPQDRYRLGKFSPGHVELAARHGVPVVPFALAGAEEQMTVVANLRPVAKLLRFPFFPITTTLGLPKPVRYQIVYGEPMTIERAVLYSSEVRRSELARVQGAVAQLLREALRLRGEHA